MDLFLTEGLLWSANLLLDRDVAEVCTSNERNQVLKRFQPREVLGQVERLEEDGPCTRVRYVIIWFASSRFVISLRPILLYQFYYLLCLECGNCYSAMLYYETLFF